MTIQALIFDVDGTLADTEDAHRAAFNRAFERLQLGWSWSRAEYRELLNVTGGKERIAAYIGALPIGAAERARLLASVPAIHQEKTRYYTRAVGDGGIPLRDGVERLIAEAIDAGCQLAIASTTTAANVDALLGSAFGARGLDLFNVIACGDQVRAKKPAPDIYHLVLSTLDIEPHQAVAVEDSVNGLRSASAAHLWTLVTPTFWTEGSDFSGAGLVLPRLGDPDDPLEGEPGGRLLDAAWLTFDELTRHAHPARPISPVHSLYQGAHR